MIGTRRLRRFATALVAVTTASVVLVGCTETPDWVDRGPQSEVKAVTEIAPADRGEPVDFGGELETGDQWASADHLGEIVVVNFWYAGCPPCRIEADDLETAIEKLGAAGTDVTFIGVNTEDTAATVQTFQREFSVTYPSILDQGVSAVRLAFAGDIPPNAIPTTLVLDREGRVAARILGAIDGSESTLRTLVNDVAAEG